MPKRIVLFASGSGSNAARMVDYFASHTDVKIAALFCNRKTAGVLEREQFKQIPTLVFNKAYFESPNFLSLLEGFKPDLIVLAGFLWKIPKALVEYFPKQIINIHPALLPKYGGKGMFGMHVHRAVYDNQEAETGISVHFVNENYDEGDLIFQASTHLSAEDTPDTIAQKIHQLEHEHYPKVVAELLKR